MGEDVTGGRCGSAYVLNPGSVDQVILSCVLGAAHKGVHTSGSTTWTDPEWVNQKEIEETIRKHEGGSDG